jgi:Uma2 family endonuclease
MAGLIIELPTRKERTEFNLRRWEELLDDRDLARIEGRIETDRHGNIIMSPPPAPAHGGYQSIISFHLLSLMRNGRTMSECPISTADGVRAADVAWASAKCLRELGNRSCFPMAPEICVEVLSPRNIEAEINDKKALYFEAGAKEVWICDQKGKMTFYSARSNQPLKASALCPEFPKHLQLP